MQRLTGFTIKTLRLINRKCSATSNVYVAWNVTVVTCAKRKQSYTSGAPAYNAVLIRNTEATIHTRLTITGFKQRSFISTREVDSVGPFWILQE